jgi:hypothetical protein
MIGISTVTGKEIVTTIGANIMKAVAIGEAEFGSSFSRSA